MVTALKYAWHVATNIFYLLVVLLVLSQLHERPESIIVPVLGLVYVRLHMLGLGLASLHLIGARSLDRLHEQINRLIDPDHFRAIAVTAEIEKTLTPNYAKLLIDYICMGLVSLACLWKLFVSL